VPDRLWDRQHRLLPDQGFAQDAGEEAGRGFVRPAGADADRGQPEPDAVEEPAPGVVGQQEFADRFWVP
jgi:hypothetical protein